MLVISERWSNHHHDSFTITNDYIKRDILSQFVNYQHLCFLGGGGARGSVNVRARTHRDVSGDLTGAAGSVLYS